MKAMSFASMLKNIEMALGIDNVNSYMGIDHVNSNKRFISQSQVLLKVCFKSSEEATHKGAAPEVRKIQFCTFANFKAFEATSMLLKVQSIKYKNQARRLTWT